MTPALSETAATSTDSSSNPKNTTHLPVVVGVRVRQGWSGEVAPNRWAKFDIELEEDDLRRILSMAQLPFSSARSVDLAFQLLEVEAERLVYAKLVNRYGYPTDEGRDKINALNATKAKLLERIRASESAG